MWDWMRGVVEPAAKDVEAGAGVSAGVGSGDGAAVGAGVGPRAPPPVGPRSDARKSNSPRNKSEAVGATLEPAKRSRRRKKA